MGQCIGGVINFLMHLLASLQGSPVVLPHVQYPQNTANTHRIQPAAYMGRLGRGQGVTFRFASVQQIARTRRPLRTTPKARAWK
eukprot:2387039-Amphidinium_carterae.1